MKQRNEKRTKKVCTQAGCTPLEIMWRNITSQQPQDA